MYLWESEKNFLWGSLIEVGPGGTRDEEEIGDEEAFHRLVNYHAELVGQFIAEGAAFVLGCTYIDDQSFRLELSTTARPTNVDAESGYIVECLPQSLFFAAGSPEIVASLDMEYAIGNHSLHVFRNYRGPMNLGDPSHGDSFKGALYTDEGRKLLCQWCDELISFGSDGEYLQSYVSGEATRGWLEEYRLRAESLLRAS